MTHKVTYNPLTVLREWDKINGYRPLPSPDKSTRDSDGNLYLQTLYHKNYELERAYMQNRLKTISAEEYFCGE